jgi:hypothetical protein
MTPTPLIPEPGGKEVVQIHIRERLSPELAAVAAEVSPKVPSHKNCPTLSSENREASGFWEGERQETACAENRSSRASPRFAPTVVTRLADHERIVSGS